MGRLQLITAVCSSIVVLCMAHIADAELIQKDWKAPGDGLITLDTVTGLEWLDLTATGHRSYEDVSTELDKGNEFEGFTYASEGEVRALFTNAGIPHLGGDWDAANYQPTLALQALIGTVASIESFGATYERGSTANSVVGIGLWWDSSPNSSHYEQARVIVGDVEIDRIGFLGHWLRRSVNPSTSFLGNVVRWENRFRGATTGWDTTTVIDPGVEFTFNAESGQAAVVIDLTADTITWDFDMSVIIPGPENVDTISDANGTIPWIVDVAIDPSTNVAEAYEPARLSFTGNSISLDLGNVSVTPSSVVKLNVKFGPEPEFPWELFLPAILHGARTQ